VIAVLNSLANLAGYFDGEGCISFSERSLIISVKSADDENLRRFHKRFGGNIVIAKTKGNRQLFRWGLTSSNAQAFLTAILPFLAAKRDVALFALAPTFGPSGIKLSTKEKQLRDLVAKEISAINQRVTVCQ
jgi:hypothetical protein